MNLTTLTLINPQLVNYCGACSYELEIMLLITIPGRYNRQTRVKEERPLPTIITRKKPIYYSMYEYVCDVCDHMTHEYSKLTILLNCVDCDTIDESYIDWSKPGIICCKPCHTILCTLGCILKSGTMYDELIVSRKLQLDIVINHMNNYRIISDYLYRTNLLGSRRHQLKLLYIREYVVPDVYYLIVLKYIETY